MMSKLVLNCVLHERALATLSRRGAAIIPKPPAVVVSAKPAKKGRRPSPNLEILTKLRALFPAFTDPPVPLAIGIGQEIIEQLAGVHRPSEISLAMRVWCGRTAYLEALAIDGAVRVWLDGTQSEPVSAEHQEQAKRRLARRRARRLSADEPRRRPTPAFTGNSA
jgi:sRNA-binding protein